MSFYKKQNWNYASKVAMPTLARGVDRFGCVTNERASILILFLPCLLVASFLLFGGSRIAQQIDQSMALDTRLDVCAVRVISKRQKLYEFLTKSNLELGALQLAIYALRGASLVPVVGALSKVGEAGLLELARGIVVLQNAKITQNIITEVPLYSCAHTPFSTMPATCIFSKLSWSQFHREHALFPDIPGRMELTQGNQELLETKCSALLSKKLHSRSIMLNGSPTLRTQDFRYAYK